MSTIMVAVRAANRAAATIAMRQWLDDHHIQPSLFRYKNAGDGVLVLELDFAAGDEAEAFAAAFLADRRSTMSRSLVFQRRSFHNPMPRALLRRVAAVLSTGGRRRSRQVSADFAKRVLTITLPRSPEKIAINVSLSGRSGGGRIPFPPL